MRKVLGLLMVCFMFLVSGCALTKDYVDISYSKQIGVAKLAGADNVTVKVNMVDERNEKEKISAKKNGYGMEMAAILPKQDVVETISKAIEAELDSRGFNLGDGQTEVYVELVKLYSDFKIGMWSGSAVSDFNMNVQVKKNGQLKFAKSNNVSFTKKGCMMASGANVGLSINPAIRDGIKKLFDDQEFLNALLA